MWEEKVIKTQIICEIGSCWESFKDIEDSIEFAKSIGAVPKLQAYLPSEIAEPGTPYYQKLEKHMVPRDWMLKLKGSGVFYSVFGMDSLDFLQREIKPEYYKIASPQAANGELIRAIAKTEVPTIMSVGGCNLDQIRWATKQYSDESNHAFWWSNLTLLHAVVAYPPSSELIGNLRDRINGSKFISWGLSSHSNDVVSPIMAVALGATMIEKHFKIRDMGTPDGGEHSLNPEMFDAMVKLLKVAENHLKTKEQPTAEEMENLRVARR